jgi:hypothetical protein
MNRPRHLVACVLCLFLVPAALPAAPKSPEIDPIALAHLKRMCDTLAEAPAFTYQSRSIVEAPTPSGQSITLFPSAEVALKRPDKLRVELRGEAPAFDFFYNGKTAAAFAPTTKNYSLAAAPPTIDAMLPALEKETGIRLVTAPLLFSDPYAAVAKSITSASVVGSTVVKGIPCQHLAFRSKGVDWEIWIEEGDRDLPRRLVVNFTEDANLPRMLVEFTKWNLRPWLRDSIFDFEKPDDGKEIPFVSVRE